MAGEESASDKTEDATPRRRQQEREKGRVPKSRDLAAALMLLVAAALLRWGGYTIAGAVQLFTQQIFEGEGHMALLLPPDGNEILPYAYAWTLWGFLALGPILFGILIAAGLANYVQTGFIFATKALEPDINKLNPVTGFKRMFSLRSFMTLAMNVAKIILLVAVAWPSVSEAIQAVPGAMDADMPMLFNYLVDTVTRLAIKLAAVLLILGVADYGYQRYQMEQDMKMTKQEVKEEYKDTDGNPEIKQKRRQMQRQMAQKRMMQEVPQSDVVIRNPTHYAVALKYDFEKGAQAPVIVAKGVDKIALKIIECAKEARVLVWTAPPLARQLYKLEVGEAIPSELFQPVAEILSHVYRRAKNKPNWLRDDPDPRGDAAAEAGY